MTTGDDLVIDRVEQLTPAWLTRALRTRHPGVTVTDAEVTPVGTGQMGASYRIRPVSSDDRAEADPPTPTSFVVKLPNPDPSSRPMVAGAYRTEVRFYTDLAASLPARTPECHFAAISEAGTEFVLLLEDLAPSTQGDQLRGCGVPAATDAVRNLARLHGPRWCDASLIELDWLIRADPDQARLLGDVLGAATDVFTSRFGSRIDDDDRRTLAAVAEVVEEWILAREERFGLLHGDYRLDNLMFPPGEQPGVATLDWQTLSVGLPARDLSYFLVTSLLPDVRRAHEVQLVRAYQDELLRLGVSGHSFEKCFDDYRFGALQGPLITVLGATYSSHTERGDEMFLAMTSRACAAIRDLESLELV